MWCRAEDKMLIYSPAWCYSEFRKFFLIMLTRFNIMLNILTITLVKTFCSELRFLQYACIIQYKDRGRRRRTSNFTSFANARCRVYLHATFLFLARSACLRDRRVLSSDRTEDDFEVLELSYPSVTIWSRVQSHHLPEITTWPTSEPIFCIVQHYSGKPFGSVMFEIMLA